MNAPFISEAARTYTQRLATATLLSVVCCYSAGCQTGSHGTVTGQHNSWSASRSRSQNVGHGSPSVADGSTSLTPQSTDADQFPEPVASSEFDLSTVPAPPADSQPSASRPVETRSDKVAMAETKGDTSRLNPVMPPTLEEATEILTSLGAKIDRDFDGNVRTLDLAFTPFNHSHAELLPLFSGVSELDLTGTDINDFVLKQIAELTSLQSLKLKGTAITDDGVQHIAALDKLKILDLGRTQISDAALTSLRGLTELNYLLLHHTKVTDAGVIQLKPLTKLRGLNLIDSQVTTKGLSRLEEDLPHCLVVSQTGDDVSYIHLPAEFRVAASPANHAAARKTDADLKLRRLQQLAQQDPDFAEQLAEVFSDKGQWDRAVAILRVAANASPHDHDLQYRFAESLAYAGHTKEAYELLSRLVGEASASYTVGTVVYDNALRESESYLERSVKLAPHNATARKRLEELKEAKLWGTREARPATQVSTVSAPRIIPRPRPSF
ncbi:hypothetical protein [Fuerstiella marisgermanici]|uniref:Putative PEP-CTERM system TPR-repeat lipoprotein n=1 Tax=Fuerstiella marisgermanici TaxID=1891926 RepID=A0A1P8WJT7_9PLAN|nr:hypothetical protein [Fuerstiella marisgermanici]APZ94317.1 putative PEP-CTERM system TPR-repeat lipoprotein [Fuerstiella marisgermanici]